ncbi:response regulator transcription factor [Rheinheimera metallidurans]|uniref:response regulator transcription factor n=1 Tax=Rheinheimera metallidurans TaxID=2925781 RepID=UPI0030016B82
MKILLIEDNVALANQLVNFMQGLGWLVDYAGTGQLGLQLALQHEFDVILLDLNLPDLDGLQVCQNLLASTDVRPPILMLTARDAFKDKASGFAAGADDYLTKPFDLRELALRCEALSRRRQLFVQHSIKIGPLALCRRQHQVWWHQQPITLTATGFHILQKLMEDHPYPSSRRDLIAAVWPTDQPESNTLKVHIYTLRKSLDAVIGRPLIHTISSVGYQLTVVDDV